MLSGVLKAFLKQIILYLFRVGSNVNPIRSNLKSIAAVYYLPESHFLCCTKQSNGESYDD